MSVKIRVYLTEEAIGFFHRHSSGFSGILHVANGVDVAAAVDKISGEVYIGSYGWSVLLPLDAIQASTFRIKRVTVRCNHDHPTHARTVEAGVYKSHEHSAHATVTFTHSGGSAYLPGVPTVAIEMRGFLLQDCRALWEKILSGTITPDISFGKFDPARDHLQGYPSQEAEEDALAAGGRAAEHGTRPE